MTKQSKTIAFRLHEALEKRLSDQAVERHLSVGEYVRQIVISHLTTVQPNEADSAGIGGAVAKLEEKLRLVAIELLINAGQAEPDEALAWASTHFASSNGTEGAQCHDQRPPRG